MSNLPAPMVPPEVDLSDFDFMPLGVRQLRDSRFAAAVDPEEFRAGLLLWCASWHQKPAGSLPDDDVELAGYAGYGRVIKEWRKYKKGAMHGFVLCSDGRWYHPIIAEKALEAWDKKLQYRFDKEIDRLRQHNKRHKDNPVELPTFEEWKHSIYGSSCTTDNQQMSGGQNANVAGTSAGNPPENALKGQGQGQGNISPPDVGDSDDACPPDNRVPGTPTRHPDQAFALDIAWQPSDQLHARMLMAGIPADLLSPETLVEFTSYWATRNEKYTQAEWEHRLLQRLIALKSNPKRGSSHDDQAGSGNYPRGSQPPRKLTPVELAIEANREYLIANGLDPDGPPPGSDLVCG